MSKIDFEKWLERVIERGERWIQTPTGLKRIEETKGTEPDYIGDGIAVWQNVDENEDEYIIVLLF